MPKINKTPRISLNKLAEYLEANVTRRKQIIHDAKYPEDVKGVRYKSVKEVIFPYLITHRDKTQLQAAIDKFSKKSATTTWQVQDRDLSVDILNSLLGNDLKILNNCQLSACEDDNKLLAIKGVSVSVRPDIIISKTIKGVVNKGAIKLHTSKTYPLNEDSQKIVTCVLFQYVTTHMLKTGEVANPKLCISFDLFTGKLIPSTGSCKAVMNRVEAACEEIALRWPTL